jgi:ribonuclease HI
MLNKQEWSGLIEVYIDGLFEPVNSGGAACFSYIIKRSGVKIDRDCDVIGIGSSMTSNVADYTALIRALKRIRRSSLEKEKIVIKSDSMLVVNQMNGNWKVKEKSILPLYTKAKILACGLDIVFEWILREENTMAEGYSRFAYKSVRNKVMRARKKFERWKSRKYFQF